MNLEYLHYYIIIVLYIKSKIKHKHTIFNLSGYKSHLLFLFTTNYQFFLEITDFTTLTRFHIHENTAVLLPKQSVEFACT